MQKKVNDFVTKITYLSIDKYYVVLAKKKILQDPLTILFNIKFMKKMTDKNYRLPSMNNFGTYFIHGM